MRELPLNLYKLLGVLPILALISLLSPVIIYSYTYSYDVQSPDPPGIMIYDSKDHDMNQVRMSIQNTGQIGQGFYPLTWGGIWPRSTENNYVFGSGLWFGGKADVDDDGDLDKVFVQGYNVLAGDSELDPGRLGQDPEDSLARIFDSNDPDDLAEWPDEFRDPETGDPIVHSQQDFATIYNDVSGEPVFGISNLGIEVRQRSMAFTHDLSENVIYFEWDLTNVSDSMENGPYTFEDAWIGFDMDSDVGVRFADDLSSFFRERITPGGDTLVIDAAIAWDADFDESNFAGTPGFLGLALIRGPGNDADGIDNDSDGLIDESPFNGIDDDGDGDIDEPDEVDELGLVNFCKHCGPSVPCEVLDPMSDQEGYDILSCLSDENPESSSETRCLESTTPSDIRFMISSGPFDWLPGQTIQVLFAVVFASPVDSITQLEFFGNPPRPDPNDSALVDFIATVVEAREFARSGYTNVGIGGGSGGTSLTLPKVFYLSQNFPNPFNPMTTIGFDVPDETASGIKITLQVYDIRGRLVRTLIDEPKGPGSYQVAWDGRDGKSRRVASGVYFYKIMAGDFSSVRKMVLTR
jgi:hypothetical protein